tara:strand:- start:453 stop:854 length:402 start_codon:yes stop_codon:yes gene_type:complete
MTVACKPARVALPKHDLNLKEETMEFVVLGKYTAAGLSGFAKNPNEDRKAVIGAMMEKAGGKMHHLWLTRGEYDAVVVGEAPDFETVAAIKVMVLASGAMDDLMILEAADFNAIGKKAADMMGGAGAYKAPGG